MSRILSVWLPDFALDRLRRDEPGVVPEGVPFALAATEGSRLSISAATPAALAAGIRPGQGLADARAILPALVSRPAEPDRDAAVLARLARWSERYGPAFHTDGPDGFWVDITGVAHLYGGEDALLSDAVRRLARLGFAARAAPGDGLGAAWAMARFSLLAPTDSRSGSRPVGVDISNEPSQEGLCQPLKVAAAGGRLPGGESPAASKSPPRLPERESVGARKKTLALLPVEALRLDEPTVRLLRRLGLKRIGQLYGLPRAPLERRFRSREAARAVLTRLDQVLGLKPEPLRPMRVPPKHLARALFAEPLIASEGLEAALGALAGELCQGLAATHRGASRLVLSLYRSDGSRAVIRAGLSRPSRTPAHMTRLLREKLGSLDAGFGIDVMQLAAPVTEPLAPRQSGLSGKAESGLSDGEALAGLIDRLSGRLGAGGVLRLAPQDSHLPERAEVFVPALQGTPAAEETAAAARSDGLLSRVTQSDGAASPALAQASLLLRPPLLLATPEPMTAIAGLPEGPPEQIGWRGTLRRIRSAEGPERIAPEWWREIGGPASATRDYYVVEDEAGLRLWVFREGLAREGGEDVEPARPPAWYVHGVFG